MTGPYYSDDHATLWLGAAEECFDWLSADVLIFDPPYGIAYQSGARRDTLASSILNDGDTSVRDRALTDWGPTKPALVFGSWRIPRPTAARARLIWDTGGALGMGDLSIPWKPSDQEIYVLGDGPWTGHRGNNVLRFPPVQATARRGRQHPHQKPVPLMAELVSKTVGEVADPTAGVGSTLVAAKMLGRRCIGVELDEAYCEITAKRLQNTEPLDMKAAVAFHQHAFDLGEPS